MTKEDRINAFVTTRGEDLKISVHKGVTEVTMSKEVRAGLSAEQIAEAVRERAQQDVSELLDGLEHKITEALETHEKQGKLL